MSRVKWLSREVLRGPCLTLCTSEDEYLAVVKRLRVSDPEEWLAACANAQVHTFDHAEHTIVCAVCIRPGVDTPNAALTLAHESLHIWRRWCEYIGEDEPGEEIDAYCINSIACTLLDEYLKRQ